MQLYVLDRAKNTLATTSSFYNDKHHKELTAGASIFEFTIDKSDSAAQYMTTGNYLVFQDDRGRAWSFTILSYDETQTTKTVAAEDVSIELLNKAMDIWNTDQAYPFSYYFNLVTKGTPWKLGVNQLTDLSRKLVYTGRDTGLGRLLSVLKGFDHAECQFNIKVQQNKPVEFVVDVYKSIGTVQDNIQIVYNNELNDIKKTESRAQFVTALAGIGGLVENQATTDPGLEKHIDFADIDYKDDNFVSPKGDKFLRAVTANRTFNPGTTTYIEDFYDYDTQSSQELLNRTLTQLKERSEPQYTYDADVKVIDPTLDIGDTVTIIDHDYNPALYLQARVATLDKSYTDPTQGAITFCNYRVLNSNLSDQLRAMQNIIDQLPTSASIKVINNNIVQMITDNAEFKKQVALSFESANGKSRVWFSKSATAQDGDVAFIKNADGATEIWKFVEGAWKLDTGLATFEDVKKAASAAADAGSQAVIAGQQASAAGADAKSAGDFAASAASQSTIETVAARSTANSAVDQANLAVSQAGFANDTAGQAKSAATNAQSEASSAFAKADSAVANALSAQSDASIAVTQALSAAADSKDAKQLAGAVSQSYKTLTDGSTMTIAELESGLAVKLTKNDLNGYATEDWAQNQINVSADGINGTISSIKGTVDGQTTSINDLKADSSSFKSQFTTVNDTLGKQTTDIGSLQVSSKELTTGFNTLTTDNTTNKNDISQLKQTATEVSSTLETVQTRVNNSAVGTNLIVAKTIKNNYVLDSGGALFAYFPSFVTDYIPVVANQKYTITIYENTISCTSRISYYNSSKNFISRENDGKISASSSEVIVIPSGISYIRFSPDTPDQSGEYKDNYKIEKGTVATDWCLNPLDNATVTAVSSISQTVDDMKFDVSKKIEQKDLNGYATQSWSQGQLSLAKNDITASVQNMTSDMATQTWTQGKLNLTASSLTSQIGSVKSDLTGLAIGGRNYILNSDQTITINGDTDHYKILYRKLTPGVWTFSANASYTRGTDIGVLFSVLNFDNSTSDFSQNVDLTNGKIKVTFTVTDVGKHIFIYAGRYNYASTVGKTLTLDHYKLEQGNKATDWTPAPEDQATVADVSSQITQLKDDINLRVKTGDLVSQIDVNAKRILLDGASTYITNTTHIDTGVIKTAMIADAAITNGKIANAAIDNAKIADASINSAKIADLAVGSAQIADGAISSAKIGNAAITSANIADASIIDAKIVSLDGSKIVAHSITADKLAANAIQVGLNNLGSVIQLNPTSLDFYNSGQRSMSLQKDGMHIIDYLNGEDVGLIHVNRMDGYNNINGLEFDLNKYGDYMAWGQRSDDTSLYNIKLGWFNGYTASQTDFNQGFNFEDYVTFDNSIKMHADQGLRFTNIGYNNSHYASLTSDNRKVGILFGTDELYFMRHDHVISLADILSKLGYVI